MCIRDSNGDGLNDATVTDPLVQADTDNDGVADHHDLDSDNDGLSDALEAGAVDDNGDGVIDDFIDENGDGFDDATGIAPLPQPDQDNDGIVDHLDLDSDNDGLSDSSEAGGIDADGNGQIDEFADDNNDGLNDATAEIPLAQADTDNDGIADHHDLDSDNDGLTDAFEAGALDENSDGIIDGFIDENDDGFDDATASGPLLFVDTDGDTQADWLDLDSDNDGLTDTSEAGGIDADGNGQIDDFVDENGDGLNDTTATNPLATPDTDNDGVADHLDLDSDNDGLGDALEAGAVDENGDGVIDDFADENSDGLNDTTGNTPLPQPDQDNDGMPDHLDLDSDNDGLNDLIEAGGVDSDGDGTIDDFADDNGDGFDDTTASAPLPQPDFDGDGIPDHEDLDSDNDGISDSIEAGNDNPDTDGDGQPDHLDLDSDNDGLVDVLEAGGTDVDGDGVLDDILDSDNDGMSDSVQTNPLPMPDFDTDGIANYLDVDSDNAVSYTHLTLPTTPYV